MILQLPHQTYPFIAPFDSIYAVSEVHLRSHFTVLEVKNIQLPQRRSEGSEGVDEPTIRADTPRVDEQAREEPGGHLRMHHGNKRPAKKARTSDLLSGRNHYDAAPTQQPQAPPDPSQEMSMHSTVLASHR